VYQELEEFENHHDFDERDVVYPANILYAPSMDISNDLEKHADLKQMLNESKVVETSELIFNNNSFSEKLPRPLQILGKRRKNPEFLAMTKLARTISPREFDECTFLAGMAL
jgi:hypothetical protein